jgi:hypothetical protein
VEVNTSRNCHNINKGMVEGCLPCFLNKFSFASSIRAFHSFSRTKGGRSCLRSNWNFSLYWALVYFKFSPANFVTTFLLNVLSNKFTMWSINSSFFLLSWPFHRVQMVGPNSSKDLHFDFYEHCLYGKQNQVRFPSGATRSEGILHLVHSDVFGHVSVPSLGKSVYYVSFIDDFLRNTWIYFLRKKSEVFDRFKEFKALIENQTKKELRC